MHLTPREQERLLMAAGADLARRRLQRGAPLGATEAVALVCDEICELAWDGTDLATIIDRARTLVPTSALLPGVPAAVPHVQVEALFPHGTTLVHVSAPFGDSPVDGPGAVRPAGHEVPLAQGRRRRTATLHNNGPQAIWVSSHVPLDRLNPALRVQLDQPGDYRLDLPAGQAVRVDAGQSRQCDVVALEGSRR
ncbi:MAG TPA: urease subunit gamma [Nocardioidaceae bacterium]|nr:urease subunit gamma [Nocardioidaceae bacterium]